MNQSLAAVLNLGAEGQLYRLKNTDNKLGLPKQNKGLEWRTRLRYEVAIE